MNKTMTDNKSRAKKTKDLKFPQDFFNIKCVIYTLIIASIYWFIPRNVVNLILLSIFSFFSINWYNYSYVCEKNNIISNIIYSIIISSLFWYLPTKNKSIIVIALYIPYFILAWYDYFANCMFRMNPTLFPLGRFIYLPVKPDPYKRRFDELDPIVKANIANFDKYVVVTVVATLIGVGIYKYI